MKVGPIKKERKDIEMTDKYRATQRAISTWRWRIEVRSRDLSGKLNYSSKKKGKKTRLGRPEEEFGISEER